MPPPPSLVHNPLIVPALVALALTAAGLLLRGKNPPGSDRALLLGAGLAAVFGAGFAWAVRHAIRTSFLPGGAFPELEAAFGAVRDAGLFLQGFFVNRRDLLTAGGAVLLGILGAIALIRRRGAFFWGALGLACGAKAEMVISEGRTAPARWLYLGAVLAALLGAAWGGTRERDKPAGSKKAAAAVLLLLAALGLGLGFYRIDQNPRFDEFEATNALVAVQLLEGSRPTQEMIWSYFPRSYGADSASSALFTIPASWLLRLGGVNLVAFRATSIFWGVLSALLIYLLGRSLIGTGAGMIAAALITFSPWHLTIYRAGMFGGLSIAFTLLTLLMLLAAVRSGRLVLYLLLGLLLSFYGFCYLPVKFLLPLAGAVFLHRVVFYRGFFRRDWAKIAAFGAVFGVFFLLQAGSLHLVADTAYTSSKGGSVYPFIGSQSRADMEIRWELVPGQLLENLDALYRDLCLSRSPGSFTYPPEKGLLNRSEFMLALLGLGWSLANWKRTRGAMLLLWLVPALAPFLVLVRPIGSPPRHLLLGIPLAALLAGAFLQETGRALAEVFPGRGRIWARGAGVLAGTVLLGTIAVFGVNRFFQREEPDLTAIGRMTDALIRRGYRVSIHFHRDFTQLTPGRIADFLSYPSTGKLFRHHTSIRHYYDYHEVASDPWRRYRAGAGGMTEFLAEAREEGFPAAVIGDLSLQDAVFGIVNEFSPGNKPEVLTGLDGKTAGYYFLLDPGD